MLVLPREAVIGLSVPMVVIRRALRLVGGRGTQFHAHVPPIVLADVVCGSAGVWKWQELWGPSQAYIRPGTRDPQPEVAPALSGSS